MKLSEKTVKVHLYDLSNVLKPRGTMKKESIGDYILQKLHDYYESWTDKSYGDIPTEEELLALLKANLNSEVESAWKIFRYNVGLEK